MALNQTEDMIKRGFRKKILKTVSWVERRMIKFRQVE